MEALDGNAIGGLLTEVFGEELTAAHGACGSCGTRWRVAELAVYVRAPGTVVRCPSCGSVLMTFVEVRQIWSVDMQGLAELEL